MALAFGHSLALPSDGHEEVVGKKEKESETQSGVEPPHSKAHRPVSVLVFVDRGFRCLLRVLCRTQIRFVAT
jgi:hypothetical protein